MEDDDCLRDPITFETFTDPIVASDGITYDYATLVEAMKVDPLRLSPFTKEPLRNLVFVNNHLRELLGLKRVPQDQIARILYKKIDYHDGREGLMKSIHRFNPKDIISDPIIILLFQRLNIWDKILTLKVITRQEEDKWAIYGPPPIAELKSRIERFVHAIHFDKLFKNPDYFGVCSLYVYDAKKKKNVLYTTIEHILGSLVADECFEDFEEEEEGEKETRETEGETEGDGDTFQVFQVDVFEKIERQGTPKYIGGFGHFHSLKDSKSKIVYRDLRCFQVDSNGNYGGLIVHRTQPFMIQPFFDS